MNRVLQGLQSPAVLLCLATLFWAGNNVVVRAVISDIPPIALSFCRWSFAFVLLTPFVLPHLRRQWPIIRSNWRLLVLLGFLGVAIYNTFVNLAVVTTTAINVSLVNAVTPAVTVFIAWVMVGAVVTRRVVLGMALSFLGVGFIVAKGDLGTLLEFTFTPGDILMLPAVIGWAIYTVGLRFRPVELHPLVLVWVTFFVGSVIVGFGAIGEWLIEGRGFELTTANLAAIGYVGVFPSLLAFVFWNRGVERLGADVGAQFQN